MATDTGLATKIAADGAASLSVSLSIYADAEPGDWRRLAEAVPMLIDPPLPEQPDSWRAALYALAEPREQPGFFLTASMHVMSESPGKSHWQFDLRPQPDGESPPGFVAASTAVGGYPKVLARLFDAWPTPQEVEAEVSVAYAISPSVWDSRLIPRGSAAVGALRRGAQRAIVEREALSWRLTGGWLTSVWASVAGSPQDRTCVMIASGKKRVTIAPGLFEDLDRTTWHDLSRFLTKPVPEPRSTRRLSKRPSD